MTTLNNVYTKKFISFFPKNYYLLNKEIKEFDDEDWSNYFKITRKVVKELKLKKSIELKGGKIKNKNGI